MDFKNFMLKFNFITNILILFVIITGVVWSSDSNGIWHRAQDVVPGLFGEDEAPGTFSFNDLEILNKLLAKEIETDNLTIQQDLEVLGYVCIAGVCKASWDEVVYSGQGCSDGKAVTGFYANGTVRCNFPNAVYR